MLCDISVTRVPCSTIYHLLRCVSPAWDDFLLRIDIVGIVVMVMGSFAVGLHTGFRCRPALLCEPTEQRSRRWDCLADRTVVASAPRLQTLISQSKLRRYSRPAYSCCKRRVPR